MGAREGNVIAYEDGVFATFYDEAVQDKAATIEQGFPVFNDALYVRIQVPNSTDCVPRPANDADKQRFPKSWKAYETGKEPADEGFPIEEWNGLSVSERKVCDANQIKTVEMLAEIPDSNIQRLGPGGQGMKSRAQKFLKGYDRTEALEIRIKELEAKLEKAQAGEATKKIKVKKAS